MLLRGQEGERNLVLDLFPSKEIISLGGCVIKRFFQRHWWKTVASKLY